MVPLIIGIVYLLKRMTHRPFSKKINQPIVITHQMSIGSKERLMCIDIDGKQLLLGITPYSISALHVFTNKDQV
jgi:flagellar protein FliO/FliZ